MACPSRSVQLGADAGSIAEELVARLAAELLRLVKDGRVPKEDRARVVRLLAESRRTRQQLALTLACDDAECWCGGAPQDERLTPRVLFELERPTTIEVEGADLGLYVVLSEHNIYLVRHHGEAAVRLAFRFRPIVSVMRLHEEGRR